MRLSHCLCALTLLALAGCGGDDEEASQEEPVVTPRGTVPEDPVVTPGEAAPKGPVLIPRGAPTRGPVLTPRGTPPGSPETTSPEIAAAMMMEGPLYSEQTAAWKNRHPAPWDEETELEFHRIFSGRVDRWMDAGYGTCLLKEPLNSKVVRESLLHFEGVRTMMISLVVMRNHVHTLLVIHPDWRLEEMVHSWKGYSVKRINALAKRSGALWQKDYFDRLVRDTSHFQNCVRYIRRNPEKAGLQKGEFILWENSLAAEVE